MNDSKEIVYLENRMQRLRGRWRAMSRIARMGIVSMIFGLIGLIGCFFLEFIPFLGLPFSFLGMLIGGVSFALGFFHNLRRDGFWFPLTGLVLSMLGFALSIANWSSHMEEEKKQSQDAQQQAATEKRKAFSGRWLQGTGEAQQSLEMTQAGSLLWKGNDQRSQNEEAIARFDLKNDLLTMSFGETTSGQHSTVRYKAEIAKDSRLLLSDRKVVTGQAEIDMSGIWNRVGPPRALSVAEKEIEDFQLKLKQFREQRAHIASLTDKFEADRKRLLIKLKPYETDREKDDRWTVWARELTTVIEQAELLKIRQPKLEQAIVRLESAISLRTRQAELDQAGLDSAQLEDLLLTTDRLEEELKSLETSELVEEFVLQQTVTDQFNRDR